MIDGVIFDMDGVLVDNMHYHAQAWRQLGRELGKNLSFEDVRRVFGQRNREIMEALIGPCSDGEEAARRAARKEELYRGFMKPALKPHTGLMGFLDALKRDKIRMAVATSGPVENAAMVLDGLEIRRFFDVVTTGAEVSLSKPDPEIFLLSAAKLGLIPVQCVVFEDSIAGIQAARRAGCVCIGVATTHTRDELEVLHPSRIITDFSGLTPSDLAAPPLA